MPETPTPDEIARWAAAWTRQCGSCDAGLPMTCTCPDGDPRDVITRLLALVAAQAEQNAELRGEVRCGSCTYIVEQITAERDAARAALSALHATDDYQRWARAVTERDAAREAVGRVQALCDEVYTEAQEHRREHGNAGRGYSRGLSYAAQRVRAALNGWSA